MRTFLFTLFRTFLVRTRLYRLIFALGLIVYSFSGSATVYYVSTSGNDSNTGKSTGSPWKTLAKVNSFIARPGDKILFKKGNVWEGTLVPASSGSSGSPITYGSYGTGERPKIYSSKKIGSWSRHSGNIYKAKFNGSIEQLFINGDRQKLARFPNEGYIKITKVNSSTKFTSTSLKSGINYKGASWIGRTSAFTLYSKKVTASSSQTLTIDKAPIYGLGVGEGFFLANKLEFLDQAGEWYYDSSSKTVYLWTPTGSSPNNFTVRGSIEDNGVNITNRNYVIIKDLEITHSAANGIYIYNSDYITIDNNRIISPDLVGIHIPSGNASSPKLTKNYVYEANANAIRCYSANAVITDNVVENTGLHSNINKSTLEKDNFGTGIFSRSTSPKIEYNRIINSGYAGINWKGQNGSIKYNFINHACLTIDDAGGIYTYNNSSDYSKAGSAGSEVMYNIILNVHGNREGYTGTYDAGIGIYMDDLTHDVDIKYNTISGCNSGVYLHVAGRIDVQYNQISDCIIGVLARKQKESCYVYDNVVYAFDRPGDASWWNDSFQRMLKNDGKSPKYNRNQYIHHYASDDQFNKIYSFSEWKSATKQDANSTFDGSKLADGSKEELFYNDTKQSKSISLGSTVYTDINGKNVSGTITLKPFTSRLLIKKNSGSINSNNSPSIQNQSFELQGAQQKNNYVGKVIASDPDQGQQLNYSIIQGNDKNLFTIHPSTGEILVNNSISATSNVSYSLVVKVTDNDVKPLSKSATITIKVLKEEAAPISDLNAPTISSFRIPSTTLSLTIPISSFSASDNNGVTGYIVKETSNTPSKNDNGWVSTAPNSYTVSGSGNKTLYAWVKDAAGNISGRVQSQVSVTLPDSSIPGDDVEYVSICEGDEYFGLTKSGEYKRTVSSTQNNNNLITNPDFSSNVKNWRTWSANSDYELTISMNQNEYYSAPGSMRIYCSSNGSKTTNLHLISNGNFKIIQGKEYELTFNVKATAEFQIGRLVIQKNSSPWTVYGTFSNQRPSVTKEWTQVKVKFTATHTATDAMFRIYLGNSIPRGQTMYIDDFSLSEFAEQGKTVTTYLTVNPASYATEDVTISEGEEYHGWTKSGVYERVLKSVNGCDSIVTTNLQVHEKTGNITGDDVEYVTICEGEKYFGLTESGEYERTVSSTQNNNNLITNPDFSSNVKNWRTWSANSDYELAISMNQNEYYSAPGSMRIYCSSNGTKTTNLHLISNGSFEIIQGKEYELTFNVKATAEFQIGRLVIQKNSSPWTIYGTFSNQRPSVTKQWTQVKVKFTATHTATDAMFRIYLGNSIPRGQSMYVDDFSLREFAEQGKTVTTYLTVNPASYTTEGVTISEGEEYQGWTKSGVYERVLRSAIGCDSIVTTNLTVANLKSGSIPDLNAQLQTEVQSIIPNGNWKVFPNPATDKVNINFSELPEIGTKIRLRDNTGRQIILREVQSMQERLDIRPLPPGMYFIEISSGEHRVVNKLIKK